MKLYRSIKTTPMLYHKVFYGISLILMVFSLSFFLNIIHIPIEHSMIRFLDLFFSFFSLVFVLIAACNLHKLNIWAWLATMAYCIHLSCYSLYRLIVRIFILPPDSFGILLLHFGLLIFAIFTACYYYPRRPLFLVGITMNRWAKNTSSPFHSFLYHRCPICCHKFHSSDVFCGKCGHFVKPRQ